MRGVRSDVTFIFTEILTTYHSVVLISFKVFQLKHYIAIYPNREI